MKYHCPNYIGSNFCLGIFPVTRPQELIVPIMFLLVFDIQPQKLYLKNALYLPLFLKIWRPIYGNGYSKENEVII